MLEQLAQHLSLGALLDTLSALTEYQIKHHWPQGEFHHDLVIEILNPGVDWPGSVWVVSSDCNGGLKEVICLAEVPSRWGLWHHRCPDHPDFSGALPWVYAWIKTSLWFDPCSLLGPDAPSEIKPAFRQRQWGGGWELKEPDASSS